jgi:proline racemase
MMTLRWVAPALLALGLGASPASAAGLVIEHATVLPMTGAAPMPGASVVIEDGRITAILPPGSTGQHRAARPHAH